MKGLLVLFILVLGILIWKYYPSEPEPPPSEPPPSGPPSELTDTEGRTISVSEITRYESYIRFVRAGDGRVFDISIDRLSPESRQRVETMEITPDRMPEDIDHTAIRRRNLETRIEYFNDRIEHLRSQMRGETHAGRRTTNRQIGELQRQKAEAIEELQRLRE